MIKQFDSLAITGTIPYKRANKIQLSIGGHVLEIRPHETVDSILVIKNLSGKLKQFPRLDDRAESEVALCPYSYDKVEERAQERDKSHDCGHHKTEQEQKDDSNTMD